MPRAQLASRTVPTFTAPVVKLTISATALGRISRGLFGANLLWPYDAEGTFDPATHQFYPAFVDEVRRLGITALRYPGGISSDSFDWLRAIGPEQDRLPNEPYGMQAAERSKICCTLDRPVASVVGPSELGELLDETGATGTITVNFVTGTAQEAAELVAYMTAPDSPHPSHDRAQASYWAALRARFGHRAPFDVPYWEVGNEQNGPYQFGWRSGRLVSIGPNEVHCPRSEAATCLYAFGGVTRFVDEPVGTFADELPRASKSTGQPDQCFYVYYPPVVPKSLTVYVAGKRWEAVKTWAVAGPRARAYELVPALGEIRFGNGRHGSVPPEGARVTVTYESGPHGGFVEFYRAMKKMDPRALICESEQTNTAFLRIMGRKYPYDCVELHEYAQPRDIRAPMTSYEESLLGMPAREGATLADLQRAVLRYSGRDIPVVLTEYGQLVTPMPVADPDFNLSLDEGLLTAAQLRQWMIHGVPLAERYLLSSTPFLNRERVSLSIDALGLSVDSAMIAGPGPSFIVEPTGLVIGLMSRLAGAERLASAVVHDPVMEPVPGERVHVLELVAATSGDHLDILVINTCPTAGVRAEVAFRGIEHTGYLSSTVLDGPGPLAFNTLRNPDEVTTTTTWARVGRGNFAWAFPAHSVSLLQLGRTGRFSGLAA